MLHVTQINDEWGGNKLIIVSKEDVGLAVSTGAQVTDFFSKSVITFEREQFIILLMIAEQFKMNH